MTIDKEFQRATAGRNAIDALETELPRPLDPIDGHAPVPGIAEVDRTAGMDTDVVRAVELLILEMRGEHLAAPVGPFANERGRGMLADDEVQLRVVGHAVAFVGRTPDLDDAASGVPAPAHVGGHVGKQQIVIHRMPDRSLGELEARPRLADRRVGVDQVFEFRSQSDMRHRLRPCFTPGTSCAAAGFAQQGRAPGHAAVRPRCRLRSWPVCREPAADSVSCSGAF